MAPIDGDSERSSKKRRKSQINEEKEKDTSHDRDEERQKPSWDVSRGISDTTARKQYKSLKQKQKEKSPKDQAILAAYDQEQSNFYKERLRRLRKDDTNPDLSRLNEYQKRSYQHRRQGKDKVTRARLQIEKSKRYSAAVAAADAQVVLHTESAGMVEAENDMERTTSLSQVELKRNHLDEQTSRHIYDLKLTEFAPYGYTYDRSGRSSILYGQRGHIALMDCIYLNLQTEFHVQERIRDACFLHNPTMLAVAQQNHVYIYDDTGAEIHKLNDHNDPFCLQFLSYHWLLASVGRTGRLRYHDTSTGELLCDHKTKMGPCSVMRQNPSNAIIHLGHSNGTVTLWSPASSQYQAKLLCHKGAPITSMAIDKSGNYMVTGGVDRQVKVWDLRMFKETHAYFTNAGVPTSMDISQRNILGIGHAGHTTFWSPQALTTKVKDPYMHHAIPGCGPVSTLRFRPFEDVCGIGHAKGISSIVIPGSGEPNLDTSEYNTNPYQDKKQRREAEVRSLLDKLSPNMITMNPDVIGGIEESDHNIRLERIRDLQEQANASKKQVKKKEKAKKRGRSKIQTKLRRKQRNVVDEQTLKLREAREEEKRQQLKESGRETIEPKDAAPTALKRFF